MDQNTPRDEATGAQPPADAGGADTGAWNQAPSQDPSQPAASGGQDAAAEYAAWSADASYQQQAAQQQAAQQQAAQQQAAQQQAAPQAQPSDTQAYAVPEPQSATYSDPAAQQQQAYQQPQYYDPNAQQQQQGYQQPQYYDPNAYGQQQQPQGNQQPQYYDPNAYGQQQQPQGYQQPQYYDPNAYGQQQGYYDQNAYQQQQYAQQGYGQQPGTPYAYAQPGQDAWAQAEPTGYGRSFIAVLSGWVLLTWGLVIGIIGAIVLWMNSVTDLIPADATLSQDVQDLAARADDQIIATGGIALILGLIHLIGAMGIFAHRGWGRAFGIVLGFLGVLVGLGIFTISAGFEALDVGLEQAIEGEEGSVASSLLVTFSYLLVLLGMFVGRRQFKKQGVED